MLKPTLRDGKPNMNYPLRCDDPTATDVVCDDQVVLTLQYSTQWDSLAHVGQMFDADGDGRAEDVFYNGYRAGRDIIGPVYYDADGRQTPCDEVPGAHHLGVQNMAESCMQGRGVMVDLEAHFGRSGRVISHADLIGVLRSDGIEVEAGDFVLFRTGFARMLLEMKRQPDRELLFASACALDGRDPALLRWVTESGAVALISDNYAVEAMPARPGTDRARPCRCTSTASSSWAAIWARCGTSPNWRTGCAPTTAAVSCSRRRRCACPARWDRRPPRWQRCSRGTGPRR